MVRIFTYIFLAAITLGLSACKGGVQFGLYDAHNTFAQVVTFDNRVDVLFVIDTSQSMAPKQTELSKEFAPFVDGLVAGGFDFHIAVTTMDMSSSGAKGGFVGTTKVITRNTPNASAVLSANLQQGNSGSDLNRGLEAMKTAITKMGSTNTGFWRSDATFVVIFLSDEDDYSSGKPADYISYLDTQKPLFPFGFRGWFAHSIVVPSLTTQCKTYIQFASPGYRFMNLSDASTGVTESICEPNLLNAANSIKKRILQRLTEFHLDREPVVESIQVWVNGVALPKDDLNGWSYRPEGYTISFHGDAIPEANAIVQVDYKPVSVKE